MPWKPPADERPPNDERIDRYRDRVAKARRDDGRAAMLYCRVDVQWTQNGGHLWWRRFSRPRYVLEQHWLENGEWSDFVSWGRSLEDTLCDFDNDVFLLGGEAWNICWLDTENARTFREAHGFDSYVP